MSDATDRQTALARLTLLVQPEVEPALTTGSTGELQTILDKHLLATTWAVNTSYTYGQIVLPIVRNGHRYRCMQAGTSGANASDEPSWPKRPGVTVYDGMSDPSLIWQEFGPDFENIYDVRAAAHECWMLKAEKCSNNFSMKIGSLSFSREQIYEHCLEMAHKFAPVNFG